MSKKVTKVASRSSLIKKIKLKIAKTDLSACCKKHLSGLVDDSLELGMPLGCSAKNGKEPYQCIMDYGYEKLATELGISIVHFPNRQILALHFEALNKSLAVA